MATTGDTYTVQLKPSHLDWGDYRHTTTRSHIYGEGYIPLPRKYAEKYSIYNSNHHPSGLGYNLFYASSKDGFLKNVLLLAQGSSNAGDKYAKQFSVQGDLQQIGAWYSHQKATPKNHVKVTWTSPTDIFLELI